MKSSKKKFSLLGLFSVLFLLLVLNVFVQNVSKPNTVKVKTEAQEIQVPLTVKITSPVWGTTYIWKDKATTTATVGHTYPLDRVVFQLNTDNNKNVCTVKSEPFTCTYTVPYTGSGRGGGGTAGYGMSVYAYDTLGNVGVDVLQLWSHK